MMFTGNFGDKFFTFELDDWIYTDESARKKLLKHFGTKNLKGYGIDHLKNGIIAAGAILYYLEQTQHTHVSHIRNITQIEESRYVRLDRFTTRSLELLAPMNEEGTRRPRTHSRTSVHRASHTQRDGTAHARTQGHSTHQGYMLVLLRQKPRHGRRETQCLHRPLRQD